MRSTLLHACWFLTSICMVMKVMITEHMRETLTGELGYRIEEVEDMEPQVSLLQIVVWSSRISFPSQMVGQYVK